MGKVVFIDQKRRDKLRKKKLRRKYLPIIVLVLILGAHAAFMYHMWSL